MLLHGAYMTTADFGPLLPGLAAERQVVVCDLHGHGRTSHADRPITYEGMADDAAALLEHLGVARADVIGFSMGGGVAIQLAVRHPHLVRALVPISAGYRSDGMHPELLEMIPTITPEAQLRRKLRPATASVSAMLGPVARRTDWRGHAARDSLDVREGGQPEAVVVRQFVRRRAVAWTSHRVHCPSTRHSPDPIHPDPK